MVTEKDLCNLTREIQDRQLSKSTQEVKDGKET